VSASVVVFVLCVAACVVAHAAILVSSVSARSAAEGSTVPRPRPMIEFIWALIPIVALALVLTATWARVKEQHKHPPAAMKVAT